MGFDYRTSTGLGKQTLEGHKQNLVCTRNQEEGAATPRETESDLPVSVQEPLVEVWVDRVAVGSGALNTTALGAVGCAGISLFAGGLDYHHSVQFSCSVVSNSLQPHGLQHARPPCPSPTPGIYSNSCPLSQ